MKRAKRALLASGFGQAYFEHWWRYRAGFDPLCKVQRAAGICYIHIPKTAGTSMLQALGSSPVPYTHCPARVIWKLHPEVAANLRFITVVRNPFDRFASTFRYITQHTDWPEQRRFARDVIGDMSFVEFTAKIARARYYRNLILGYEFFAPQTLFTHDRGKVLIHDLLRFETLQQDFETKVRACVPGVSALPALRDHGGGDYKAMYDDAGRALIRDLYAEDFRAFDYAP